MFWIGLLTGLVLTSIAAFFVMMFTVDQGVDDYLDYDE